MGNIANLFEIPCRTQGSLLTGTDVLIPLQSAFWRDPRPQPFFLGSLQGGTLVLEWGDWNFDPGIVGSFYDERWDMVNVPTPVTYSLISGALPPGLILTDFNSSWGKVTGTPTAAGVYAFTLRAIDPNIGSTADKAFTITIYPG